MEKTELLRLFINDRNVSKAVYDFLRTEIEKPNGTFEVQLLAAERLALMSLKNAWNALENLRSKEPVEGKEVTNIGL